MSPFGNVAGNEGGWGCMLNKWCPRCPSPESSPSLLLLYFHILRSSRNSLSLHEKYLLFFPFPVISDMQSTKEKLKDMASAAKQHVDISKTKIDEKAEKATARTKEEKVIAHERAKAKEAKAKMELHEAKARHAAERLGAKPSNPYGQPQAQGHRPVGAAPMGSPATYKHF